MNISAPFISRPIATWLLAISLLLCGLLGYSKLPVAALPQVDFPTIQVITRLPGASSETIASLITAPLERQFGLIPGLSVMLSTSAEGVSAITLQFSLEKDIDIASEDVQAAINAAGGVLPANLPYPPSYSKVNPADLPILTLALTSDVLPITRLNDVADTILAQKLSQISGVGRVLVEGGQRPAFRLQMNPDKLASFGMSLEDVRASLAKANVNLPKGSFDGPLQSLAVGANDQLTSREDYLALILATHASQVVRVRDVGNVVEGVEDNKVAGWVNGHPAVILNVQRQPGANVVATADKVKALLPQLSTAIPAGVKLSLLADRTETIRASVHDVQFTLVLTILLVVAVIYAFLHSPWATIIPGVALPLSLVATFALMQPAGFSLNNLSLMALTIAAGFVVDDAIVMVENIVRYIEKGEKPLDAAFKGAKEIGFTIISLTLSLIAVFIPLLFMSGIVGRLFREFAMTLTFAVLISAVVSLTLTPMMCAQFLKKGSVNHEQAGRFFTWLHRLYEQSLGWVLKHEKITLWVFAVTLILTMLLYVVVPKGFLPLQDTGQIIATTDAPETVSFEEMRRLQQQVAAIVEQDPDVEAVASFLGGGTVNITANTGRLIIMLKPHKERHYSVTEIMARLAPELHKLAGVEVHMQAAQDIQIGAESSRTKYQYTLTDLSADELQLWAGKLLERLAVLPVLEGITTDQEANGLKAHVEVDRHQAERLGVSLQAIDDVLYDAFGQRQASTLYAQVNQYRVILEVEPRFAEDMDAIRKLYVRSTNGRLVPIAAFARVEQVRAPLSVTRQGGFPSITISFNVAEGKSLGQAIKAISQAEAELHMPASISGNYSGEAAEFRASLASEPLLILAALVVIYIVLGMLYESTIHPLTILSTLPSAGLGALLALLVTGQDLSVVALIGIVLLMGIVKKNAIMMIDFALEAEREEGLSPREAIFKACMLRFRPIMMTTMAALLGAIPLAIDQGIGAELRRPLGITIVGGLMLSQLLTLYTTPVIYLLMGKKEGGGSLESKNNH